MALWLFWFLGRKRSPGKAMRAYSDNEDLALLSGVDPDTGGARSPGLIVRSRWPP